MRFDDKLNVQKHV